MNLKAITDKLANHLLKEEGIVGISYHHSKPKIIIYVESKDDIQRMPKTLANIPVEVIETGKIEALQHLIYAQHTEKVRPLVGGISGLACCELAAGTLGIVSKDCYILSNAHVLAMNFEEGKYYEKGHEIVQPAPLDNGGDVVGYLERYIPIVCNDVNADNYVDSAIAKSSVDFVPLYIEGIGAIRGWSDAIADREVIKSGRTTGITQSYIIDTNATIKVEGYPEGWAVFRDCIVIKPSMTSAGDSGSILVDKNSLTAVGLIFAGSDKVTIACKISNVIKEFNIDLGEKIDIEKEEETIDPIMGFLAVSPLLFLISCMVVQ